jgi:hypothetical protein
MVFKKEMKKRAKSYQCSLKKASTWIEIWQQSTQNKRWLPNKQHTALQIMKGHRLKRRRTRASAPLSAKLI